MNAPEATSEAARTAEAGRFRVLFVDDEADMRRLVALALARDPSIEVQSASSAQEALAILAAGTWMPDCMLLDSRMPAMRGEMLVLALRASPAHAHIPIVMLTANASQEDAERYAGLGAAGLIAKPFDPLSLAKTLRSILRR